MIRLRLLFAIPLAALAFAGCGGDDAPSKEDFAADAEKICADLEKQGDELSKAEPDSVEEVSTFATDAKKTETCARASSIVSAWRTSTSSTPSRT